MREREKRKKKIVEIDEKLNNHESNEIEKRKLLWEKIIVKMHEREERGKIV